jgi:hypothetical protein
VLRAAIRRAYERVIPNQPVPSAVSKYGGRTSLTCRQRVHLEREAW